MAHGNDILGTPTIVVPGPTARTWTLSSPRAGDSDWDIEP